MAERKDQRFACLPVARVGQHFELLLSIHFDYSFFGFPENHQELSKLKKKTLNFFDTVVLDRTTVLYFVHQAG